MQYPLVVKLLTFPFPNWTMRYWENSSNQRLSSWSVIKWSLTIYPIMRQFSATVRKLMECSFLILVPWYHSLCPEPTYMRKQSDSVSPSQHRHLHAPKLILDQQFCSNPSKPCLRRYHQWTTHTLAGSKDPAQQEVDAGMRKVDLIVAFIHFSTAHLSFQSTEAFVVLEFGCHTHSL